MTDANDAQIKIYLYLLRALQSGRATTVPEIADHFNHTERDVKRALQFWEKRGLVRLEYDAKKRLSQICLEDLSEKEESSAEADGFAQDPPDDAASFEEEAAIPRIPEKRKYSPMEMARLSEDKALSMTLFAAEQYFKRTLSSTETQTVLYIYEELAFPVDLIDYLLQYTAENARGRLGSYLEKTAIAWHGEGIRTLADAKKRASRYDRRFYEIMRALGLTNAPTSFEAEYFSKWLSVWNFPMDVVEEACKKTVSNTQSHRVEYADGILRKWYEKGVHSKPDIARLDDAHRQSGQAKRAKKSTQGESGQKASKSDAQIDARNRFNRFQQHDYDFEDLKQKLVSNR
ncbi:MAG: DnaD domain protein [Lachnospiraceae bacterium]|nr:DnaD domain protein [Lachnospiraceae bacterium]